ncbi:uncharacterized protein LOC132728951 [Ruditapes philippinarum]|uniref:uncharacterized protein LOC132728951 n=1 Tax=Ruditapes philippinarum TaxID=129788 RepID=UPI00295B347E|nr:uncharacterized protein LOC132728951 [Ruditapes philippinarum]
MQFKTVYLSFVFLFSIEYCSVFAIISTNATFNGYRKWAPVNNSRDDMYCPDHCYNNPDEDERCCCCEAVTCWQLDPTACNVTIGQLYVEYKDIYGSALFIPSGNHTLYEAVHRNGRLTKFPDNLCDFADSLVTLDLSFNRIKDISSITCLKKLDTLRLDSNKITELSNETFSDMKYLRIVSMSRNYIETLDPNTIQKKNGNILVANFSFNILESIDITNIVRPGPFCEINYEGCEIATETNVLNYVMHENNIHGPGNIILRNTSTDSFLNFSSLGVHDFSKLGFYFKGQFDFDDSDIACDCKIYPVLADLGKDAARYWPRLDIDNITCRTPEHMKGRNLNSIYKTQSFGDLTCDLPNCPKGCTCTDTPIDDEIKVVCKGLTSMPDFTPVGYWNNDRVNLDCSDPSNEISHFPNKEYMSRLVSMNLNGNDIRTIDNSAAENIGEGVHIDISGQLLKYLPDSFRKLNPNRIIFGTNPVECNCDNVWIGDWVRNNRAHGNLKCSTSKGLVPAEDISSDFLDCLATVTVPYFVPVLLGLVFLLLFTFIVLSYYFRYEILLLKRKLFDKKAKPDDFEYDAMFSFSEDNMEVFRWIERGIMPALRREGYSVFVPFYDISFGSKKEDHLTEGINKSRNYVVFLCSKYLCDESSVQEFEILWKQFYSNASKNIIVVNFDNFSSSEIKNKQLSAFRRIEDDVNFIDREIKILERMKQRIGPPRSKPLNVIVTVDEFQTSSKDACEIKNDIVDKEMKTVQPKTVHERLAQPKKTTCNCRYRKCYLCATDMNSDGKLRNSTLSVGITRHRCFGKKTYPMN